MARSSTSTQDCPTLTYNTIGRHQSRLVRTRVASNQSPWLMRHASRARSTPCPSPTARAGSWRPRSCVKQLAANGQIATQYVDLSGNATA